MSNEVVVSVKNLTKRFGKQVVFENVSLDVKKSEVVAIVGPSGAGKSTFIRCINRLHPFDEGTLHVLNHQLSAGPALPPKPVLNDIRTRVGMVFQTFNLFPHLTVLDNIILAPMEVKKVPRKQAVEHAMELLDMVGLANQAKMYPKRLSGGMQQRVAIARALAMEPEIMLFDEPTSMLDPELVGEVLEAIQRLAKRGMTMILVTHEMMFAKEVADTVVIMADHTIVEKGPARKVLEAPQSQRARLFLKRVLNRGNASGDADLEVVAGRGGDR
ncbi:amino acid ABC transporter ATP-binding protein [Alicyclobacillus tolerans]|uniref:amino acid ABC transporter ATP-binding protein n=1 Tax=Alicyclobacillus tolerans TaxID=90970 RepID=UPI001F40BC73|nr:amino acid ABC transporter ATP-binding protein [Alicyclobacillus tolerans]MCF8565246.1 amino acid ABC transporter ATP-binding protein [Alicyclobacillus tolerans]